ncbi:hypothetical protein WA158_000238 [Blastocystis sp. Blastoise]
MEHQFCADCASTLNRIAINLSKLNDEATTTSLKLLDDSKVYKINNVDMIYPEKDLNKKQSSQQEQALVTINKLYNEVNMSIRKMQTEKENLTKEKRRQSEFVQEEVSKMIESSEKEFQNKLSQLKEEKEKKMKEAEQYDSQISSLNHDVETKKNILESLDIKRKGILTEKEQIKQLKEVSKSELISLSDKINIANKQLEEAKSVYDNATQIPKKENSIHEEDSQIIMEKENLTKVREELGDLREQVEQFNIILRGFEEANDVEQIKQKVENENSIIKQEIQEKQQYIDDTNKDIHLLKQKLAILMRFVIPLPDDSPLRAVYNLLVTEGTHFKIDALDRYKSLLDPSLFELLTLIVDQEE